MLSSSLQAEKRQREKDIDFQRRRKTLHFLTEREAQDYLKIFFFGHLFIHLVYISIYICTHAYRYFYIYTFINVYICICACLFILIFLYVLVCVNIYDI